MKPFFFNEYDFLRLLRQSTKVMEAFGDDDPDPPNWRRPRRFPRVGLQEVVASLSPAANVLLLLFYLLISNRVAGTQS
jgi:hypothetical protein